MPLTSWIQQRIDTISNLTLNSNSQAFLFSKCIKLAHASLIRLYILKKKSFTGAEKMISGKEISENKPPQSATSGGQLLEEDSFHVLQLGSRGQWLQIGCLLCFPMETDVKVSVNSQLHCQQLGPSHCEINLKAWTLSYSALSLLYRNEAIMSSRKI